MFDPDANGGPSVVVPAYGGPSTTACLRSLGSRGINTITVSEQKSVAGFYSKYCDEAYLVPDPDEDLDEYLATMLDIASRPDVRTIIPTREADIYVLSRYRDAFESHISLPVPRIESLLLVHDRLRLGEEAAEAGVPYPRTRKLSDGVEKSEGQVVKSRYNLLVPGVQSSVEGNRATEVKEKRHVAPEDTSDLGALRERMHHDPIVQEYVAGEEYMVGALYDHGEQLATVQHHQVRGMDYTGSGGVYRVSTSDSELEEVSTRLLDHLDWHGLACLEYVRDERTGEFKLIEINPRMWQSLAANVRMGADFPYYYWLQATGRTDQIDPSYEVGVGCHWLKGEFLHLLSLVQNDSSLVERPGVISTTRDIVTSIVEQPNFDYLSLDDPGPFLQDWWALLMELPGVSDIHLPGASPTPWHGRTRPEPTEERVIRDQEHS